MIKGLGILIDIGGTQFELSLFKGEDPLQKGNEVTSLLAAVNDRDGAEIDLVNGLLKLIDDTPPKVDESFTTIILYAGSISFREDSSQAGKLVGMSGNLGWKPKLSIGNEVIPLYVDATFQFYKELNGEDSEVGGFLEGMITTPIPGIEFLTVGARYDLANKDLFFLLKISQLTLCAKRTISNGTTQFDFALTNVDDFTLGEMITFFVSLVDPSVDKFEFDPPWKVITDFNIGKALTGTSLLMEFRPDGQKVVGFRKEVNFELTGVYAFNAIRLSYEGRTGTRKKDIKIHLEGTFLGNSDGVGWDPVNDAPPALPGKDVAAFDLRYLGLGQHVSIRNAQYAKDIYDLPVRVEQRLLVSIRNAQYAKDIGEIMRMLRGALDANEQKLIADRALRYGNPANSFLGDDSPIEFNAQSELLIGLDVSMLKFLSLSIIFNDPIVYGLRIELSGEGAKNFAGLQFEILYQKITDTIGKYHVDLTLPDYVRRFNVGSVSVTLPVIVIDIFTNGDFKLDLGFPWNFNFARSFALEMFPFIGFGGFYFNKLSAATAVSTPKLKAEGGVFTPVYEFGLGLKVGYGKTFISGPFRAEISITIQGLIEGIYAFYNYAPKARVENPSLPEKTEYYMIKGGVALVGRLYGVVDFKVVKAKVELLIEALMQFNVESYQPTRIKLSAKVTARASIKVATVRIRFSFSMQVEQEFEMNSPEGKPEDAPWHSMLKK